MDWHKQEYCWNFALEYIYVLIYSCFSILFIFTLNLKAMKNIQGDLQGLRNTEFCPVFPDFSLCYLFLSLYYTSQFYLFVFPQASENY